MQRDGLLFLKALVKVVALQHLRNGESRREPDDAFKPQRSQPFGIESHFGLSRDREF